MKLITRQTEADSAAERWRHQYEGVDEWQVTISGDTEIKYMQLKALGENPRPSDVDKVIGNKSWTEPPACNECGETYEAVIEVGEEPDYDSSTAIICKSCLSKAMELFGGVRID